MTGQPVTAAELAADLGVGEGDVQYLVSEMIDLHDDKIPPDICGEIRLMLNPHGERTAPANLYWPGHVEEPRPASPTAEEGFYPEEGP